MASFLLSLTIFFFALHLSNYTPIFLPNILEVIMGIRKLRPQKFKLIMVTVALSACTYLRSNKRSQRLSILSTPVLDSLAEVRFVWASGRSASS